MAILNITFLIFKPFIFSWLFKSRLNLIYVKKCYLDEKQEKVNENEQYKLYFNKTVRPFIHATTCEGEGYVYSKKVSSSHTKYFNFFNYIYV